MYSNSNSTNTQKNVDQATKSMRELAQKISAGKNYDVTEFSDDGIIYAVIVTPLNASGSPSPSVPSTAPTNYIILG